MYRSVIKVVPLEDFTLEVAFDNGEEGVLDMKPYLDFGVFRRLSDFEKFKEVHVGFGTLQWDSDVDLDPEFVYSRCRKVEDLKKECP